MRFTLKLAFCFIVGFFAARNLHACCAAEYVGIHPREGAITQNPVFLLEFTESEFNLSNKWEELEFYLVTNKKRKVKVNVLRKVSGVGPSTQLLLKADGLLKLNDSVRLQVNLKKGRTVFIDDQFKSFQGQVNRKQWQVTLAADHEPVAWASEITWHNPGYGANSIDLFGINFTSQVADNNPVHYEFMPGKIFQEQLFEITIAGQVFYAIGGGPRNEFSIYQSDCGGNFRVKPNQQYEATVTALDFSGNRSSESKKVTFNTMLE